MLQLEVRVLQDQVELVVLQELVEVQELQVQVDLQVQVEVQVRVEHHLHGKVNGKRVQLIK